jgi:hypothetical protein
MNGPVVKSSNFETGVFAKCAKVGLNPTSKWIAISIKKDRLRSYLIDELGQFRDSTSAADD